MPEEIKTVVLIKNGRFSYFHGWHPTCMPGEDESKKRYNTMILFPKDSPAAEDVKKVIAHLESAAKADNGGTLPGTKKQPWHNPLNDGDTDKPDDPAFEGMYYINAKSVTKPGIVSTTKDADGKYKPITDESEVYSGCYGHVTVNFFRFGGKKGDINNGIGVGLNNIMKTKDGASLSGKSDANADFADIEVDDDEDFG